MKANEDKDEKSNNLKEERRNFYQVDLLKAFMFLLVIIALSTAYMDKAGLGFELWERITIPVFLVIMGFNMGKSFTRQGDKSLKEMYS